MSAKSSKPPETSGVIHQIGPEPELIASGREPETTNVGNLGETVKAIHSDADRRSSETAEYDRKEALRKQQRNADKQRLLLQNAMIPPLHMRQPDYTQAQITQIERMVASFGSGAIWAILGDWGTGKTQMAVAVIYAACRRLLTARFTTAIEFFVYLRSPYSQRDNSRDEGAVIMDFVRPDLLVIDDAHVRAETDFENRLLHHVIDKRHIWLRETILTSNQSADVFSDTIGGAIDNRQCAAGGIIECNWESFRGKQETQT